MESGIMKWRSELSSLCPTPSALITFSSLPAGPPVAVSKLEGPLWATVPICEEGRGRLPEVGGMCRAQMGSYLGPLLPPALGRPEGAGAWSADRPQTPPLGCAVH